jgi:hypothetical protein
MINIQGPREDLKVRSLNRSLHRRIWRCYLPRSTIASRDVYVVDIPSGDKLADEGALDGSYVVRPNGRFGEEIRSFLG